MFVYMQMYYVLRVYIYIYKTKDAKIMFNETL